MSEESKNKPIYKKWCFLIIIVTIILIFIGICIKIVNLSPINNYKKQAIEILEEYKQGKATSDKTKEKIGALGEKVHKEYEDDSSTDLLFLSTELQRIEWDLVQGEISNTEANDYIREIKNIK